jgi:hypothetical protein
MALKPSGPGADPAGGQLIRLTVIPTRSKAASESQKVIDTQEGGKLDFDLPLRCRERRLGRTRNLASFLVIVQT